MDEHPNHASKPLILPNEKPPLPPPDYVTEVMPTPVSHEEHIPLTTTSPYRHATNGGSTFRPDHPPMINTWKLPRPANVPICISLLFFSPTLIPHWTKFLTQSNNDTCRYAKPRPGTHSISKNVFELTNLCLETGCFDVLVLKQDMYRKTLDIVTCLRRGPCCWWSEKCFGIVSQLSKLFNVMLKTIMNTSRHAVLVRFVNFLFTIVNGHFI